MEQFAKIAETRLIAEAMLNSLSAASNSNGIQLPNTATSIFGPNMSQLASLNLPLSAAAPTFPCWNPALFYALQTLQNSAANSTANSANGASSSLFGTPAALMQSALNWNNLMLQQQQQKPQAESSAADSTPESTGDSGIFEEAPMQQKPVVNISEKKTIPKEKAERKSMGIAAGSNSAARKSRLATMTTNPITGKKRIPCEVCQKTFCDRGALKIHFSAVHLKELHRCTVVGCDMLFSSRRSRNRHAANPNRKLHQPGGLKRLMRYNSPPVGLVVSSPVNFSGDSGTQSLADMASPAPSSAFSALENEPLNLSTKKLIVSESDSFLGSAAENENNYGTKRTLSESPPISSRKRKSGCPTKLLSSIEIHVSDLESYQEPENEPQFESGVDKVVAAVARGESGGNGSESSPKMKEIPAAESDHEVDFEIDSLSYYSSENNEASKCSPIPTLEQSSPVSANFSPFEGPKISYHLCRTTTGVVEIPVNEENQRQCAVCLKIFQNHFSVKTHYLNVHLKLMHQCTVKGCTAAFPSKRSRDRHSGNMNLHRKLLSLNSSSSSSENSPNSKPESSASGLYPNPNVTSAQGFPWSSLMQLQLFASMANNNQSQAS